MNKALLAGLLLSAALGNIMEWNGSFAKTAAASHRLVSTQEDWARLWSDIGQPAPKADLARYFAVAVFLGVRNTGGYTVSWEKPHAQKDGVILRYRVKAPDGMAMQALTQPYDVRLFPRSLKNPIVEMKP